MPAVFLFFYLHYFIWTQTQPCIQRYGFLMLLNLILHRERSTQRVMLEKMTSHSKVAIIWHYFDHIKMQFPQGNNNPANTPPVDSGCLCRLQRLPWRRPIRSWITSQLRAVISRLSVRCRTSGIERCWVWVCQRATGCVFEGGQVYEWCDFYFHIYESEEEDAYQWPHAV